MKKQGCQSDEYITVDGEHGHLESQRYVMTSVLEWFEDKQKWSGWHRIGMVESIREIQGRSNCERLYYISSLPCDARIFGNTVRRHWGIENSVHCPLDIAFREDDSCIKERNSPGEFCHDTAYCFTNNSVKWSVKTKGID